MVERYQRITVVGLLVVNDKILLIRRAKHESYLPGYYELPDGKVEFGENPENGLKREFLEEVNLKIVINEPYRIFSYISDNGRRHSVEIVYLVDLDDDIKNIRLSEDHDDYKFADVGDLENLKISDEIKTNIFEGLKKLKTRKKMFKRELK